MFGSMRKLYKEDEYFRKALALFVALKVAMLLIGAFSQLVPGELTQRQNRDGNIFINPWAQYDAAAYVDIAMNGYNTAFAGGRGNYGWYPLYPLMIRALSFVGYYFAGFVISNVLSFLAAVYMYVLLKKDFTASVAFKAVALMSLFPTSYFFTAAYTESLFLLETVAFFLLSARGNNLAAGAVGFFAALTRMQGSLLFLPSLYLNAKKGNVLYSLLIPAGLAVFMAYQFAVTGNPLAQFQTHADFSRTVSLPTTAIYNAVVAAANGILTRDVHGAFYNAFNLFILALFSYLLVYSYKRVRTEYFIFFAASYLLPLLSSRLEAISRFYLVIFPAFAMLAVISDGKKSTAVKAMYVAFAVLLLLFTIRHGNEELLLFG